MICKFRRISLIVAMMVVAPVSASAGKYCGDPVEGGKASAPTQDEALLAAQKWWSSRAGSLGAGYEDWNNANDQALECTKNLKGHFH